MITQRNKQQQQQNAFDMSTPKISHYQLPTSLSGSMKSMLINSQQSPSLIRNNMNNINDTVNDDNITNNNQLDLNILKNDLNIMNPITFKTASYITNSDKINEKSENSFEEYEFKI
jgi:hypothetical protein